MSFRKLFEDKSKQSLEFDNEFKIGRDDAKKIAKNYGVKWNIDSKEMWTMYDNKEHVMTYMVKKGELYTDFSEKQVTDMVKG